MLGHAILIAGLLSYFGLAGAPRQLSEEAVEVEIIVEPPGLAAVQPSLATPEATPPTPLVDAEPVVTETPPVEEAQREETPPEREQAETLVAEANPTPEPAAEPIAEPETKQAEAAPAKEEPAPEAEPITLSPPPMKPTPRQAAPRKPEKAAPKQVAERTPPKPRNQPARASGSVSSAGRPALAGQHAANIDTFRAAVAAKLARNRPSTDFAAKAQGVVLVTFGIASTGAAEGVRIARSSGHPVLDGAALSSVRRASPFPAPPPGAPRSFTVPMRFNLR